VGAEAYILANVRDRSTADRFLAGGPIPWEFFMHFYVMFFASASNSFCGLHRKILLQIFFHLYCFDFFAKEHNTKPIPQKYVGIVCAPALVAVQRKAYRT